MGWGQTDHPATALQTAIAMGVALMEASLEVSVRGKFPEKGRAWSWEMSSSYWDWSYDIQNGKEGSSVNFDHVAQEGNEHGSKLVR